MRLSEVCIERPVLAWVLTLVVILFGLVGGSRLDLQELPTFSTSFLTIETTLAGAGPEVIETQISRVIEEAVAGIEGVDHISSISTSEDSKVTIAFKSGRNIEDATNDVRDRLSKNRNKIPQEATDPIIIKSKADDRPIMTIALTSDTKDPSELADFAKNDIEKDLEAVGGVARVDVLGAGEYVMHIYLDPSRLTAYGLTVSEVLQAIKLQNIEKPAGKIVSRNRQYVVTTVASLEKPEEFNNLIVATKKDYLVRLRDIGRAEIDADDQRTRTFYNGQRGVSISVFKQSNSNPIDVSKGIRKVINERNETLPKDIKLRVGMDKTTFIDQSLKEVFKTIIEATILVILVVLAFLKSFRAGIIPLVTIPVSLIGTMFFMYLFNFSLNSLTLMAMVLAIGLVVDDAIVVLENIYHHIEKGMSPYKASIKGIKEVSFAVIAMTLTLVAVYAPISFAKGMTGKLLLEFSITLAVSVLISGFAALTLSPMMCSRMLSKPKKKGGKQTLWERIKDRVKTDEWLSKLELNYNLRLKKILQKPMNMVFVAVGISAFGYIIFTNLPSELFPAEDRGAIFIEGQAPQSATLDYTTRYVKDLDAGIAKIPEVKRRVTQINNPTFDISIRLREDRARSTDDVVEEIQELLNSITGIQGKVRSTTNTSGGNDNVVQFVIRANKTYRELRDIVQNVSMELYASSAIANVHSGMREDAADFTVTVIRDRISSLNIEPATIADTIGTLIRGKRANTFKQDNKMYEVRVEVENASKQSPEDIMNLFVKSGLKDEKLVPLTELVNITSRSGPVEIYRYNRMRAINFSVSLSRGASVKDGVELVKKMQRDMEDTDYRFDFIAETKRYLEEGATIYFVFMLALAFIYLVMAAQFESWRHPFIIILSVPLSLAGAVLTLSLFNGGSLNMYSNVGMITLIGLITKHGILIVDYANKLRVDNEKLSAYDAVVESSTRRLRPILMTTFAMVLGAVPLAIAFGAGAESRRQLGLVIVGGMSIGTFFTLFVIPAFYVLLAGKVKRVKS